MHCQVKATKDEIEILRTKSSSLKKKVRKANEEEKEERAKILLLEAEVAELEDRLAHKLHELGPPVDIQGAVV
jgi:predicted  nucleic acid-binding Zn-ribbon protein